MEEIVEVNRLTPQGHLVRGVRNRLLKYPRYQVKTEHRTVEQMFDAPVANLVHQQRIWDRCAESPLQVPNFSSQDHLSHKNAFRIVSLCETWITTFLRMWTRSLLLCPRSLRNFNKATVEDILDVFAIHAHQRIVVAVEVFPQERISLWSSKWEQRTVDQLVDSAVPQEEEEVLARILSQERLGERFWSRSMIFSFLRFWRGRGGGAHFSSTVPFQRLYFWRRSFGCSLFIAVVCQQCA